MCPMYRFLVANLLGICVAVAFANVLFSQEMNSTELLAQSEPVIQEQINLSYVALNRPGVEPNRNIELVQELQTLNDMTADKGEIVKQLAIFAAAPEGDEQRPLLTLMILDLLDLPPSIVIRTLAPHLNDENRNLKSFVRDWFQGHDNAGAPGPGVPRLQPINYEDYLNYIRGRYNSRQ
jgi:hypothetical protein